MKKSETIWQNSVKVFPGGVNSPVRAYKSVGRQPIPMQSGKGAYLTDVDGNCYLDFVNSWGPLILGHSHPSVVKAMQSQIKLGTSFGTVTENEMLLGEFITSRIAHVDQVRFVNSGTEAVMTALRVARAKHKRSKIIKFEGCYHGHFDGMLVQAGSGLLTFSNDVSNASSPGVPESWVADTIVLPLDDEELLEKAFANVGDAIAAVIIEPLPANSGLLPQRLDFLKKIASLCQKHGSLFIMDEVISGFRLGMTGFAGKYGFQPDLVTYGKVIGGGLPVGAIAGRSEIMQTLSPVGNVYQAGTLSGNPLAMTAGLATLKQVEDKNVHVHLKELADQLGRTFTEKVKPIVESRSDFSMQLVQEDSIFWMSIGQKDASQPVRRAGDIWSGAGDIYAKIFWSLLERGFHLAPSAYEVGFLSEPMKPKDVDNFVEALAAVLQGL